MDEKTTTESVTIKSAGNVKITLEEYNDLQARANRPQNVTYNRIEKTPEMAAKDQVNAGAICMGTGGALFVVGIVQFMMGKRGLKELAKTAAKLKAV